MRPHHSIAARRAALAAALVLPLTPFHAEAQGPASNGTATARAVRARTAPELDGREDDAVWQEAPVSDEFKQFTPGEGLPARFRTAFKVAYDDRTLYVFIRAYDPRPDSIVALLSRRDIKTPSEWLKVVIDGYHDRRTAMQFMVNPAGVKRDASVYSDVQEDISWDGVWDVATRVDSLGWTAEYAIPFSQLRFTPGSSQTFGFGIWRDIARTAERDAWPAYYPSRQTFASQLGDLTGIEGIGRNRRLELLPYVVTKNVSLPNRPPPNQPPSPAYGFEHPQEFSGGLDVKAGLTSNITIDATFNPDFGQVEADPSVLNLSAFEIRFDERRPFFQEGVQLFRCNGPCEGIFYTRRVGRPPQLAGSPRDERTTTIQGAAKITGRFAKGTQFGVVAVSSARETGEGGQTIEPQTTVLVGRLVQDFNQGRSQIGTMVTGVKRDLDATTEDILRKDAYTFLVQGYHRFARSWEVSGYRGQSVARGSEAAIRRTQLTSVHYLQRPDHEADYDSTRTSLEGSVNSVTVRRYAGRVRWETTSRYAEPLTELNDLGFVTLVNDVMLRNVLNLSTVRPGSWYRRLNANANLEQHWSTDGITVAMAGGLNGFYELPSAWGVSLNYSPSGLNGARCVSCSRGGPAVRQSAYRRVSASVNGDARKVIVPEVGMAFARGDGGRSWSRSFEVGATGRIGTRTSLEFSGEYERRADNAQWVRRFGDQFSDTSHYTFARLNQRVISITARANVTMTPNLSLQLYAQPFIATGANSDWVEIADPYAERYEDRYTPFDPGSVGSTYALPSADFNTKSFNSNAVLRWEYRPGSVLFLVWQQGRSDGADPGRFDSRGDLRRLFETRPDNTLLLKASYWFNP